MKNSIVYTTIFGSALVLGACTSTGNVERNAAIGAAGGAVAGAIIGNNVGDGDAATGAAIGAVVGGAGGAYVGNEKDKRLEDQRTDGRQLFYDQSANRSYYVDPATGKSYWANGEYRG